MVYTYNQSSYTYTYIGKQQHTIPVTWHFSNRSQIVYLCHCISWLRVFHLFSTELLYYCHIHDGTFFFVCQSVNICYFMHSSFLSNLAPALPTITWPQTVWSEVWVCCIFRYCMLVVATAALRHVVTQFCAELINIGKSKYSFM